MDQNPVNYDNLPKPTPPEEVGVWLDYCPSGNWRLSGRYVMCKEHDHTVGTTPEDRGRGKVKIAIRLKDPEPNTGWTPLKRLGMDWNGFYPLRVIRPDGEVVVAGDSYDGAIRFFLHVYFDCPRDSDKAPTEFWVKKKET